MEKTLGGERIGTGNKMKVEMHGYERSNHDLSYTFRNTQSVGTVVPFLSKVVLPGDDFDMELFLDIMTHPTIGPLFGSFKIELHVFLAAYRLYQRQLHNNTLNIGKNMQNVKLPIWKMTADPMDATGVTYPIPTDLDNAQINPSSIAAYLGIRGIGQALGGIVGNEREFNAVPLLMYWDTIKNYYLNKQEEYAWVIHNTGITTSQNVVTFAAGPDGDVLPQAPATGSILISQQQDGGWANINIEVTAGDEQDMSQIIVTTNLGEMALSEIATQIGKTGDVYNLRYGKPGLPWLLHLYSWRYATPTDSVRREINLASFPIETIDQMREAILSAPNGVPFDIMNADGGLLPYTYLQETSGDGFRSIMESQEGLAVKTYLSDMLNNWLEKDDIDYINLISAVDTAGGSFSIDSLNLAYKVYNMLNRIQVSGGSYDDWLDAVYTHERYTKSSTPVYMGGMTRELVFQEVVSNAQAGGNGTDSEQPLGSLAGKGTLAKGQKGGSIHIKADEICQMMGLISITPRLDYSQGNQWDVNLKTMDDFHKPALDQIGWQDSSTELRAWWDTRQDNTGAWIQRAAGKVPAWLNYMTDINIVRGNFAVETNEMFMVMTRRFEAEAAAPGSMFYTIKDLTTYIDPRKFNHIFAQTSLDSMNFWVQVGIKLKARRKMSAKVMPNL